MTSYKRLAILCDHVPANLPSLDLPAELNYREYALLYCQTGFNGPFYGFTPATDPNGSNFKPDLFFSHGPTFVEEGEDAAYYFRKLLKSPEAKKRLINAVRAVLRLRLTESQVEEYDTSDDTSRDTSRDTSNDSSEPYSSTSSTSSLHRLVATLLHAAEKSLNILINFINSPDGDHLMYNVLMEIFDHKSRLVLEACGRRDEYIRQMNLISKLSQQQPETFEELRAKFDKITRRQREMQASLKSSEKLINDKLDYLASRINGFVITQERSEHLKRRRQRKIKEQEARARMQEGSKGEVKEEPRTPESCKH